MTCNVGFVVLKTVEAAVEDGRTVTDEFVKCDVLQLSIIPLQSVFFVFLTNIL